MRLIAIIAGSAVGVTLLICAMRDGRTWMRLAARHADPEHARIDEAQRRACETIEFNNGMVEQLLAGQATLRDVVERSIESNRARPGFLDTIRFANPQLKTEAEIIVHYILTKVEDRLEQNPQLRSEVVPRIEEELNALFTMPGIGDQLNADSLRTSLRPHGFTVALRLKMGAKP